MSRLPQPYHVTRAMPCHKLSGESGFRVHDILDAVAVGDFAGRSTISSDDPALFPLAQSLDSRISARKACSRKSTFHLKESKVGILMELEATSWQDGFPRFAGKCKEVLRSWKQAHSVKSCVSIALRVWTPMSALILHRRWHVIGCRLPAKKNYAVALGFIQPAGRQQRR